MQKRGKDYKGTKFMKEGVKDYEGRREGGRDYKGGTYGL